MEMCIYTWTCLYIYIHTYHTYVENMRLNHKQIDENQQALDSNQRKNDKKHGEPIKTMDKSNHGATTKPMESSIKTIETSIKNMAKSVKTMEESVKTMEKR